jgi:polyphosphate kinase
MMKFGAIATMHVEESPQEILDTIQFIVLQQQSEFSRIWQCIIDDLKKEKIFLITEKELNKEQIEFVNTFFDEEVRSNVIPLMIESIPSLPYLRDKSVYLAVVMARKNVAYKRKYALIEVPTRAVPRFVPLPDGKTGEKYIILLEDVIRYCLPRIFSYFEYDDFSAHVIKVTKDAEYDLDYDETSTYTDKIEKEQDQRK